MKQIQVTARLFGSDQKPLAGQAVAVQVFTEAGPKWVSADRQATDARGGVSFKIDAVEFGIEKLAPALRLVEKDGTGDRVLATGGMMRFDVRSDVLFVDFGEIEQLADAAYVLSAVASGMTADTVAGVPRKPGLSQGAVLTNLSANPDLIATLGTIRRAPGTLAAELAAPDPGLMAELTSLRALKTETESLLAGKDQELSVKTAALETARAQAVEATQATRVAEARIASLEAAPRTVAAAAIDPNLAAELSGLRTLSLEKDALILRKDQEIQARVAEVQFTKGQLADAVKAAQDRIATLEAAQGGQEADIQSVFSKIGTKMSDANVTLKTQATPFRLGTIKIDLRGPISENGTILLGNAAGSGGSGVSVEMHADDARPESQGITVKVPEVTGLTESAVRRVLRSVGLRLKLAEQVVDPGKATPGQAILQHPAPGQPAAHGAEVLVVFATARQG